MNKIDFPSFFENLLDHTGGKYPILIILLLQTVTTPLFVLLTAMPAQDNAEFNNPQGISLLIFGCMTLLIKNIILIFQFKYKNEDLITRLSIIHQSNNTKTNLDLEKRAWKQVNSASKNYFVSDILLLIMIVLLPTIIFGSSALHITAYQIIHLSLPIIASGLAMIILEIEMLDQMLKPVILKVIPNQFEMQLIGLGGMKLWSKFVFAIIGVVFIGLLLTVPTAYHQLVKILSNFPGSTKQPMDALFIIVRASIGALFVGSILSFMITLYFSNPFRKMIDLFQKIETGDLSQRIKVVHSDEFGKLYIYLNHMIEHLQIMTSTLEQQVIERTTQLSQTNRQLQNELSERQRMEERLAYTALHDPLTNLPNRALFMDRLEHVMERAKRHSNYSFAVIFIDLDRFKVVNDSMGHNVGDLLLVESAQRLVACIRSQDTIARFGGDEFVILLEDLENSNDYIQVAERIQEELASPAHLQGYMMFISTSMGIVLGDSRYERAEDILRDADIAMYHAKKQGRGRYEVFVPSMLKGVLSRLELENNLRNAMQKQELLIQYQPILSLETRHIIGFEALLRWQHPKHGLLLPAEFMPLAEEIGLIIPIGYWVLDEACNQLRNWQNRFPSQPLTMNVNLSPRQCIENDLVDKILEIVRKHQIDPGYLKLELTESLIVENSPQTAAILSKLRDLGIQVYIDDFGSGYTSLGHLETSYINTLKIGRNFTSQMGINSNGIRIVQTILTLAHNLGMKVIAEGVETDDQLAQLEAMDCEFAQGYFIAKPLESREASILLEKQHSEG